MIMKKFLFYLLIIFCIFCIVYKKDNKQLPIITYNLITVNDSLRVGNINIKDTLIIGKKYQRNIVLYNKEIIYDTIIYNNNLTPLFK